jgi:type VI secretion system protein VasD
MRNLTIVIALFTLLLKGCGSEPEKPEPTEPAPTLIQAKITVSNQVNPDVNGRPSPIVMRIYELKNLGKFEEAGFYNLFEEYESFLSSDLLASEQFHLRPGDTKTVKHAVAPETKYLAVTAAYRDLNQAVWRDSIRIKTAKTTRLEIILDRLGVSIRK